MGIRFEKCTLLHFWTCIFVFNAYTQQWPVCVISLSHSDHFICRIADSLGVFFRFGSWMSEMSVFDLHSRSNRTIRLGQINIYPYVHVFNISVDQHYMGTSTTYYCSQVDIRFDTIIPHPWQLLQSWDSTTSTGHLNHCLWDVINLMEYMHTHSLTIPTDLPWLHWHIQECR